MLRITSGPVTIICPAFSSEHTFAYFATKVLKPNDRVFVPTRTSSISWLMDQMFFRDKVSPIRIARLISKLKRQRVGPDAVDDMGEVLVGAGPQIVNNIAEIYKIYQARLIDTNSMDFEDIILITLRLLRQDQGTFCVFLSVCVSCCFMVVGSPVDDSSTHLSPSTTRQ